MEPLVLLNEARRSSLAVMGQVMGDHRSLPTPCDGWVVSDLLDKMVTSALLFATLCRGEKPEPELNLLFPTAGIASDDPVSTYAAASGECSQAFADSNLEGEMMGPLGVMVTRAAGLNVRSLDCTLNTWDLARSIDVDSGIDADVAETLIPFATGFLAKVREKEDHVRFREPIAAGSTGLEALVALSGRDPSWLS